MAKTLTKEEKEDFHRRLEEIKKIFEEKKTLMSTYVPTPADRTVGMQSFELFNGWVRVTFTPDYAAGFDVFLAAIEIYLDDKKETAYVWRDSILLDHSKINDKLTQARIVAKLLRDYARPEDIAKAVAHSEHYDQMKALDKEPENKRAEEWAKATSALFDDERTYKKAHFGIAAGGPSTVGWVDTTTAPTSSTLHVTTPTVSQDGTVKTPPE